MPLSRTRQPWQEPPKLTVVAIVSYPTCELFVAGLQGKEAVRSCTWYSSVSHAESRPDYVGKY